MPAIYQERNAKTEIETIPQLRMRARWGFSDTDKPDTTLTFPQWHVRYDSSFPGSIYHVMASGGPGELFVRDKEDRREFSAKFFRRKTNTASRAGRFDTPSAMVLQEEPEELVSTVAKGAKASLVQCQDIGRVEIFSKHN